MQETWVWSLGQKDPPEKEMATHSSSLAWRIPWTQEPGRLESMGLQRAGHNWATLLHYQFSRSVVSGSLQPHGPQHARPPCPSPTPRVYSNSCPLSQWCHPTISSSVIPFSSCLQSFPASGSFPMSQLFASDGQRIGASALASVLPMNTQWLISLRILPPIPNKCWLIKRYIFQSQSVKFTIADFIVLFLVFCLFAFVNMNHLCLSPCVFK